jgi:CRISPR-associated protein Cmr6
MVQACRNKVLELWKEVPGSKEKKKVLPAESSNPGLIMSRYLEVDVKDEHFPEFKRNLQYAMQKALVHSYGIYEAAFERYKISLPQSKLAREFKTVGRLVIGLGGENVLETGLTLHHTYGTPIIPGTALKGLASHYCDQVRGATDTRFRKEKEVHNTLFGTNEDSGHIHFHDAWIVPESLEQSLRRDIMTPHHGDYYSGKNAAPTDFDKPNPISFFSISGTFHIALSCDAPDEDGKWTGLAFRILSEALKKWGIGGKTSAGYGRMIPDENPHGRKPAGQEQPAPAEEKGSIQQNSSGKNPALLMVNGKPVTASGKSSGMGPLYKKGQVITVTRAPDPHPKPGRERFYFKAADGFGGFAKPDTVPDIAVGQTIELEITGLPLEGGYDFALPGTREAYQKSKQDRGRPMR